MLASVERLLSAPLLHALRKKLAYEQGMLQKLSDQHTARQVAREKSQNILNPNYFTLKRLEQDLLPL